MPTTPPLGPAPDAALHPDLLRKVERLARQAWSPRADRPPGAEAPLSPAAFAFCRPPPAGRGDLGRFLGEMLSHVARVAPGLDVPLMVPPVVVKPLAGAGGQFVEDGQGWVKVVVGEGFCRDPAAAAAILCHEVCHYVLGANSIRESPTIENERLTDAAMFVFGLGETFLRGHHKAARPDRPGHRLGYLSDDEYRSLARHVPHLRRTGAAQRSEVEALDAEMRRLIRDPGARDRLLADARARHPGESEADLRRRVLDDLRRDRRW